MSSWSKVLVIITIITMTSLVSPSSPNSIKSKDWKANLLNCSPLDASQLLLGPMDEATWSHDMLNGRRKDMDDVRVYQFYQHRCTKCFWMFLESWCSGASSCTSPGKLAKSLVMDHVATICGKKIEDTKKQPVALHYFTLLLQHLLHFFFRNPSEMWSWRPSPTSTRWVLGLKAEPDNKSPMCFFRYCSQLGTFLFLKTSNMYIHEIFTIYDINIQYQT